MVVRQGDCGDQFFVVESGQYDVYLPSPLNPGGMPPELVHTYHTQPGLVASFGVSLGTWRWAVGRMQRGLGRGG